MEMTIGSRLAHAWNAFFNRDPPRYYPSLGPSYSYRPDRPFFTRGNERSIITSIYNRIALDAASIAIQHVRVDDSGRFKEVINSGLNDCLTLEANIDQTGRSFIQDAVMSMLDEGVVALVPVDTTFDPNTTGGWDILSMRTGKILEWYPKHVQVRVYNERTGEKEDITVPKSTVAIIENPFYSVMNAPNSTLQRLIRKLNLLDAIDEQSGSGKLNLIIQLPYVIKTSARRQQAEERRKDIEEQLASSKYGVAYTDGTEHVLQLNRPIDNNLMSQIEYLTSMLFSQLGLTQAILDGSADEKTMTNYLSRMIEPMWGEESETAEDSEIGASCSKSGTERRPKTEMEHERVITITDAEIFNFLKSQGLSDAGAAGLMGNLYAESGLRSNNLQNSYEGVLGYADAEYTSLVDHGLYTNFANDRAGYGLAQWTYSTRKAALLAYAKAAGKSIGDMEMQLNFLMKELKESFPKVLSTLKTASSVREASDIVLLQFERPANQSEANCVKRANYGQAYFDKYAKRSETTMSNYTNSPLATVTMISPNRNSPRNHALDTITIHCFVGQVTAKRGCEVFQPTTKQASCNYVVGKDGDIGLCVEERDRSWCTSSSVNDNRAVTIEVASDSTEP